MGNSGGKHQDSDNEHHHPHKDDQNHKPSSDDDGPPDNMDGNSILGKNGCCIKKCISKACLRIFFVAVGALTILTAIAEIAATVTTAIATKIYSSEVSGRNVAMIVLAVMAAIALSTAIYSVVSVLRGKKKGLHATMISLFILAVLQAVICGVAVTVTSADEVELSRSLSDSFRLARDDNPRYIKIWDTTQHELSCCGVYSAEDYRQPNVPFYFPPDVPVACCPGYDPNRSDLVQEREREICKARKEFYDVGCKNLVLEVFKDSSVAVLCVTILLIILEIILAVASYLLSRSKGKDKKKGKAQDTLDQAEKGKRSGDKPKNQKDKDTSQNQPYNKNTQKDNKTSGKIQEL